jgi:hypothetical protein
MLGYFRDIINYYFLRPEYEITPIQNVNVKQMKSDWYFLKNLFNDENQYNQYNINKTENNNIEVE